MSAILRGTKTKSEREFVQKRLRIRALESARVLLISQCTSAMKTLTAFKSLCVVHCEMSQKQCQAATKVYKNLQLFFYQKHLIEEILQRKKAI